MTNLEKVYSSLTKFSDLDWDQVSKEYAKVEKQISFPEYLQIKAEDGDCPVYLFELAFYELALAETLASKLEYPKANGIYLNSSALFLSLEYDIEKMLKDAELGKIDIHERPHVLCLFRDKNDEFKTVELEEEALN